jgi:hypothetical protein
MTMALPLPPCLVDIRRTPGRRKRRHIDGKDRQPVRSIVDASVGIDGRLQCVTEQ